MPRSRSQLVIGLVLLILSSGCATTTAATPTAPAASPAPAAAAPRTVNVTATCQMSDSTHWARTSAEHEADFLQTYRHATLALEAQAPNLEEGTWAVSLDADETVLDNSLYQKERQEQCEGFSRASWEAWVARREAKALPGAQKFLQRIDELGGTIAIVTNRRTGQECEDTEANFQALGLPFDVMLCGSGDKESRWESIVNGTASPDLPALKLILWIGDNIGDFPHLDQTARTKPAELDDFGTRYFVVPNAMYGSWTSNPKH